MPSLTWNTQPQQSVGYYVKAEDSDAGGTYNLGVNLGYFIQDRTPDATAQEFTDRIQEVPPAQISWWWAS